MGHGRRADETRMSKRLLAAYLLAAALAGCGGTPPPSEATSVEQVRQRMAEYNLMQITPGSSETLCAYMMPDAREAWKEGDSSMRDLLPATVVDCESYWDDFTSMVGTSPGVVEMIRTAQITDVEVQGDRATATLSFGGTFEWRWHDGRWLMSGPA